MRYIWIISYNLIVYPTIFSIVFFLSLFNIKIRKGFIGRLNSISKIKKYFESDIKSDRYWFHVSSLGEFYQTISIIELIKFKFPNSIIILSFSSPSGYEKANSPSIDLSIYLPFDFPWTIKSAIDLIKPKKIIICSYDIWPNLIWIAKKKNIHTNVFSLYMKKRSKTYKSIRNSIFRSIYNDISSIYTVTEEDKIELLKLLNQTQNSKIRVFGNPRYDTIKNNTLKNRDVKNLAILKRPKRIIIGSSHIEDDFVIPIIISIISKYSDVKILYAPHEPSKNEINRLIKIFSNYNKNSIVMYDDNLKDMQNSQIIILGVVGVLSKLYWESQIVYIGGGFSKGIHNVMEPSIAGVPILFGPNYDHANEAKILLKSGGAICIKDKNEFEKNILKLLENPNYLKKVGRISSELVVKNIGASSKIVECIIND